MSKISQELNAVMAKRVVTDEQYLALLKRENGNLGNMVRQLQEEKQNLSDALNQSTLINDGLVQQVRSARGHLNLYALFSCEGSDSYDPECAALNIDKARDVLK
jgi:hypothetical protein